MCILELGQHASEDLQSQVLLVAPPLCAALDDPDFMVEAFHESARALVLGLAVGSAPVPMTSEHGGALLVRGKPVPFARCAPVLEEPACPAFALVAPELPEGRLEPVRDGEPFVGRPQRLHRRPAFPGEVLPVGEPRVRLPLAEAPLTPAKPGGLALADLSEGFPQGAQEGELVKQARGLRRVRCGGVTTRLPPVQQRQADAPALPLSQPLLELAPARRRAVRAPAPERPLPVQIADHATGGVARANRYRGEATRLRSGRACPGKLGAQVRLLQVLDRRPVQMQLLGHVLARCARATPTHVVGQALRVLRVVGQEGKPRALPLTTASASDTPPRACEIAARVSVGQIAGTTNGAVVPALRHRAARSARRFVEWPTSVMTRALRSPHTPRNVTSGRTPGNR